MHAELGAAQAETLARENSNELLLQSCAYTYMRRTYKLPAFIPYDMVVLK